MTNGIGAAPIGPSPNGRYFVGGDGRPVFWLGDTQWELFRRFREAEALRILTDRQAKGINVILVMLLGIDAAQFPDEKRIAGPSYVNVDGEMPWIENDPLRPNEKYFRHIDALIGLGERTDQTFVVGVYHQWQRDVITLDKARPWARWVSDRYRDVPNLIWSMYPAATPDYVPMCHELAAGLREGDGGRHLICVHPDPAVASSSFLGNPDWLAFHMIQTCVYYEKIAETVAADYAPTPTRPVVMAEGGYEGTELGRTQTPHDIRRQAYWTHLAGGHYVYGHNDNWGSPTTWEQWLHSPGSRHMQVFREIVTACDGWWDLVPDSSLLSATTGEGSQRNAAARSPDRRWILAYLEEPCTVSLRPGAIAGGPVTQTWWIDPTTGDRQDAGVLDPLAPRPLTTPQGWRDAVLFAQAE